ncbi:type II secretion system protein GspM [Chitiniphilus eburneus]|uniref:Type II secretion system protein M n=1 Tax=Chitiniphilus eburneus TaxID=2571148 RepID=A0A4U0PYQ7_9NEIS|nr:type II secretion system protein M [Chitiniphilus eburneus]TJZ73786.1 type II secretion system protein M [Chitiniphilus eburneus]
MNPALHRLRQFWLQRNPRERRFLALCGTVIAVALFYALLWQPAVEGRARLQKQLPRLEADLAEMQRQIALLKGTPAVGSAIGGDLRSAVQAVVSAAGIKADLRALPDQRVAVDAPDLPFPQVLELLSAVRRDSGAHVVKFETKATGQPGRVSLNLEVQR